MNTNVMLKNCVDCGRRYKPSGNHQKRCINCGKAYKKAYQQTPKRKAYKKAYDKAYMKAYQQTLKRKAYNKAYQKAYQQTYRQTEKYKAYHKTPKCKAIMQNNVQKQRARKKRLPNMFTSADWQHAIKYFCHACAYCGEFSHDFHREHFIPVVSGGGYTPDNIVPACPKCNLQKHTKPAREFLNEIGHVERYEMIVSYLQARTAG